MKLRFSPAEKMESVLLPGLCRGVLQVFGGSVAVDVCGAPAVVADGVVSPLGKMFCRVL